MIITIDDFDDNDSITGGTARVVGTNAQGQSVTLGQVAKIETVSVPRSWYRIGAQRAPGSLKRAFTAVHMLLDQNYALVQP